MTTTIHAHRCEACAANGKEVFWIHSNNCKGILQAHKCPECGTVEWKKAIDWPLIEPQRFPQQKQQEDNFSIDALLGYIVLFAGIALLSYGIYLYWNKTHGKSELPAS